MRSERFSSTSRVVRATIELGGNRAAGQRPRGPGASSSTSREGAPGLRPAGAGRILTAALIAVLLVGFPASAQETGSEESARRDAALASLAKDAARRVFGGMTSAAAGVPAVLGEYAKGCYRGGLQLPPTGKHWQVMRLSRNRNWGHPRLVSFLEKFAATAASETGWPGILVGDLSQPRGGPMLTGHASHQLGIEADIWLRPMPPEPFSAEQVEVVRSLDLVRPDRKDVDPKAYTRQHLAILRAAAREPEVARVFVNAAIKKALCRDAGEDRSWLRKIRPAAGHTYHFHIRLACPAGESGCKDQAPPPPGDGCGKDLDYWFSAAVLHPKPGPAARPLSVSDMPKECRELVTTAAPGK